jgi:hypothetical protein
MTNMNENEPLLKTDVLGRVRTPKERREKLLDEFEQSGVSGSEFATLVGIKYQTFAWWVQGRKRERKQSLMAPQSTTDPAAKVRWLEAVVDKASAGAGKGRGVLTVQLPGRARLEIADATQAILAAALLRALEGQAQVPC